MQFLKGTSFKEIRSIDDLIVKIKEYQNQVLMGLGLILFVVGGIYGLDVRNGPIKRLSLR